jgi:hypothetical protein
MKFGTATRFVFIMPRCCRRFDGKCREQAITLKTPVNERSRDFDSNPQRMFSLGYRC